MNQDKIWESYQNSPEWQLAGCPDGGRVDFLARLIPLNAKVLNIGIGRGRLEKLLSKRGVDVHCLDPSETSVVTLRADLQLGEKAKVGYSQNIPFESNVFDYVIMTEVLEHLSDEVLEMTLKEVQRVLLIDGTFIGTVPADEILMDRTVICPDCEKRFHRWGHVQSFSASRLSSLLKVCFGKVEVHRIVFADWLNLNFKGKVSTFVLKIQASLGIKGSGQNFLFSARNRK